MFRSFRTIALSALLGLGGLAAVPASAEASNVYLGFGGGYHGPSVGFHFGSPPPRHFRPPAHHHHRACSPGQAVHKAARHGVRHARVRGMNHRVINVVGRDRGRPVAMTFARAPGCPILR